MPVTTPKRGLPRPFVAACAVLGGLFVVYWAIWIAGATVNRTETVERTYAGASVLQLDLNAASGDVDVIAEERDDVRVVARLSSSLDEPDFVQRFDDGSLTLRGGCGFWGSFGPNGCGVDFEIHVPRELPLDVEASSGDVHLVGVAGETRVRASSGEVTITDATGRVDAALSSGDLTVRGYRGEWVRAHASSGDVTVVAEEAPAHVDTDVSSGDIAVVVPDGVRYRVDAGVESGDQRVTVDQADAAPHAIRAHASSGDVVVLKRSDWG